MERVWTYAIALVRKEGLASSVVEGGLQCDAVRTEDGGECEIKGIGIGLPDAQTRRWLSMQCANCQSHYECYICRVFHSQIVAWSLDWSNHERVRLSIM